MGWVGPEGGPRDARRRGVRRAVESTQASLKTHQEGVEAALRTLRRFTRLLDAKGVSTRGAVATAAVRECEDGPDFVERVRQETGLVIDVLSGEEEGRYSALGVLAGVGDAWGVAGDLGGSSLELTGLEGRSAQQAITLPLAGKRKARAFDCLCGKRPNASHMLDLAMAHPREREA